ncbi:MAG: hypothetical protein ACKVVT_11440 [Dehalococcoidia bacterium]
MPSDPLGYLITFRCYGTWLHDDDRASTHRWNARFDAPFLAPRPALEKSERAAMHRTAFSLDMTTRTVVGEALEDEARVRGWDVLALNVRTNHVHIVLTNVAMQPERVMTLLKSAGTKASGPRAPWHQMPVLGRDTGAPFICGTNADSPMPSSM